MISSGLEIQVHTMSEKLQQSTAVPLSQLRSACDPATLHRGDDDKKASITTLIGQDRAIEAIFLSVTMPHPDFNLFVVGPPGTGRHNAVNQVIEDYARKRSQPDDWAYVNNFDQPYKPRAIRLPEGTAQKLRAEMQDLVNDLAVDIPAIFESDDYQTARRAIDEEFGGLQEKAMSEFSEAAAAENVALVRTPMGFMLTAIRDGELLKPEEFQALPEPEQEVIGAKIERLQKDLSETLKEAPKLDRERRKRVAALNAEMAGHAVSARIDEARSVFGDIDVVLSFLAEVKQDMINNPEIFLAASHVPSDGPFPESIGKVHDRPEFRRYAVNVMVSADDGESGAPIVNETLPTLDRLTGRIEHVSQMGTLITDFTMIKPGALHRANGGFLVLDARRVISEPMAWAALKQCIQNRSITITSMAERLSLVSTTSLEPDPIPLSIRVVLVGDRFLHALLSAMDPDFGELFKIDADFEASIERRPEAEQDLARILSKQGEQEGLLSLSDEGAAQLIDEAIRLAEDSKRISLQLSALQDLLFEANHYATEAGRTQIAASDVQTAILQKDRRADRVRNRMRDAVKRGVIFIDTDGAVEGQVNGLSVIGVGGQRFGRPTRITARTRMGAGKLIDIEREVELGGPLHSKGVLILSAYLSSTYALDVPFSLHASLVFEQSYGGVDGDSASAAELLALLSSLSGVPIHQSYAITGSVNQYGKIQAIGGVNEKIEGFFETCLDQGLTGKQGVLIPFANVEHLMLRQDVCDAVERGQFQVHAVKTIDEAIELLTGRVSGARGTDGAFPPDSINALVEERLVGFANARLRFTRDANPAERGE